MEPVNLTDDQRLYLQAIFDYFNTNGEWPTGRYLEQTLFQTHPDLDVDEVSSSIPEDITPVLSNGKVILSVPAIYLCQGSANLLRTFVSVIRLCFDIYTRSPDDRRPHISSNDLTSHYPLCKNPGFNLSTRFLPLARLMMRGFGDTTFRGKYSAFVECRRLKSICKRGTCRRK